MMRWKGLVVLGVALMSFVTCSSSGKHDDAVSTTKENDQIENFITLTGKVLYPQKGPITINEITEGGNAGWTDTIVLKEDSTFSKRVPISEPGYYRVNFYNTQVINVILFKNNVSIVVDGRDMKASSEITGSPEIDFIHKASKMLAEVQQAPEFSTLNADFEKARQAGDQVKMQQLQTQYMGLLSAKQKVVADLVRQQPASLGVINFLTGNSLDKDVFFDTYIFVADKLKKEWPNYYHAKEFIRMVDSQKATAIGSMAPEISLPNPDGKIIPLSSLRGKYVLVDFWAKWCGPCRQENPNVVRAYNTYKDKSFTVYGVSLDRNKEDWLKAINDDGLTWTHVSDLKYWQSEAAKTYNVTSIPFSILVDPKGVIIGKNLRGVALDKKLEELLAK